MKPIYIPQVVKIERVVKETLDTRTFSFRRALDFIPGQFLEVSCFGAGEAPISISSAPHEELLEFTFKRMGSVTSGLFNLKENDSLGIRGAFGSGFPLGELEYEQIIFVAAGVGLAPLRSLLKFLMAKGKKIPANLILLYGARTPQGLLYKRELKGWGASIKVLLTVDKADAPWQGRTGVVTELLNEIQIAPAQAAAFICGPEIMMRFTVEKLLKLGVRPEAIHLSLERYMKCGVGKCGHCYIGDRFVCREGPVFSYAQLNQLIPSQVL